MSVFQCSIDVVSRTFRMDAAVELRKKSLLDGLPSPLVILRVKKIYLGDMNGQAAAYLDHKFQRVGREDVLRRAFEPDAIKAIQKRAENPLVINNIVTAAMMRHTRAVTRR